MSCLDCRVCFVNSYIRQIKQVVWIEVHATEAQNAALIADRDGSVACCESADIHILKSMDLRVSLTFVGRNLT
jgi:hypothetical protein